MILTQWQKYRATVNLGFFKRFANNGQIEDKLLEAGFKNVTVSGSGSTRQAEGTWMAKTQEADLPGEISDVEEING